MRVWLACLAASSGCANLLGITADDGTLALSELSVSVGALSPAFDPDILEYDVDVGFAVEGLDIAAASHDAAASLRIGDEPVDAGVARAVAVAEGDTVVTVVATSSTQRSLTYTIRVHRAGLGIAFGEPTELTGSGMISQVSRGDFDGNGIPDLGFIALGSELGVFRNDGAARFTMAGTQGYGFIRGFTVGRVDSDAHPDLVIGGAQLYLAHGNGDGTYQPGYGLAPLPQPGAVAIGHFDPDPHMDVAVVDTGRIVVMRGDGFGYFVEGGDAPLPSPTGEPRFLFAAEIDGRPGDDIVALDTQRRRIDVLSPTGTGLVVQGVLTGPGEGPAGIAIADFDGDQRGDLVWFEASGKVVVQSRFPAWDMQVFPPDGATSNLAVDTGDLDGDGHIDIIVLDNRGLVVFRNDGSGAFIRKRLPALVPNAVSVAIADFNGDGRADLAFARFTDKVSVYMGVP